MRSGCGRTVPWSEARYPSARGLPISPTVAAYLSLICRVVLPICLVAGASRFAALGLLIMTGADANLRRARSVVDDAHRFGSRS